MQRTAIARALINRPSILIADEPTGNLDKETAAEIFDLFMTLHREGQTLIMVTHDPSLAERADRMYRMDDGRLYSA
jgi:putative ABC transport system ATP-binding protein